MSDDLRHMRHALVLAARGLGQVAPNPAVGCVIVNNGRIVGRGWTQPGGRPHAETEALKQAGDAARGAIAYVTLEPCAHQGITPPCTQALIAAGVARVVAAVKDPDPRVAGRGFAQLKEAGIEVAQGVCEAEARALNAGFFSRIEKGRPLVALKSAESADGFVAGPPGADRWVTSERARRHGHLLRAQHDAIMIGIGTALADDPLLTCRLEGLEHRSPVRIVVDSRLRLPASSQLAGTARMIPTAVFTTTEDGEELAAQSVAIEIVPADSEGRPDLGLILKSLAEKGVTRLLVEGGPTLQTALVEQGLADILHVYRAPVTLGGGLASVAAPRTNLIERIQLGPDVLESYALTV